MIFNFTNIVFHFPKRHLVVIMCISSIWLKIMNEKTIFGHNFHIEFVFCYRLCQITGISGLGGC